MRLLDIQTAKHNKRYKKTDKTMCIAPELLGVRARKRSFLPDNAANVVSDPTPHNRSTSESRPRGASRGLLPCEGKRILVAPFMRSIEISVFIFYNFRNCSIIETKIVVVKA